MRETWKFHSGRSNVAEGLICRQGLYVGKVRVLLQDVSSMCIVEAAEAGEYTSKTVIWAYM